MPTPVLGLDVRVHGRSPSAKYPLNQLNNISVHLHTASPSVNLRDSVPFDPRQGKKTVHPRPEARRPISVMEEYVYGNSDSMQDLFIAARFEVIPSLTKTTGAAAASATPIKEDSFCESFFCGSEDYGEPLLYPVTDTGETPPGPSPVYSSPSVSFSSLSPGEGVGTGVLESYTVTAGLTPPPLTKKGKPRKIKLWEMEGPAAERARKVRENRERKKMEKAFLLEKYESLDRSNQEAKREMADLSGEITASEERQSVLQSVLRRKEEESQRLMAHMGNSLMELEKVSRGMVPSYTQEVARNLCHDMRLNFMNHSGMTGQIPTSGYSTYGQGEEDSTDLFFA
ncbi:uncharacterized protein LOC143024292 [Oratosquilla oratoria]|uniref:uncharacterized protein LOC143024292 n=1 Tax=Oratosquilla oratoria TaxID=337810 RepID=UPI003F76652F